LLVDPIGFFSCSHDFVKANWLIINLLGQSNVIIDFFKALGMIFLSSDQPFTWMNVTAQNTPLQMKSCGR
jgi:hypothetical protein